MNFLAEPRAIEAKSMAIIEQLIGDFSFPEKEIIKRVVHATGDPEMAGLVEIHPEAVKAARQVFAGSKKIITDVKMVKAGINSRKTAQIGVAVYCAIDDPAVVKEAEEKRLTRAMGAISALAGLLTGSMVVIGNAPTALAELIRLTEAGRVKPALIVGTPVGFVGAAEAKSALTRLAVPYVTVHGTKGGSAVAVSIVNALLNLCTREDSGTILA
ncbi:MAG: precorrin-8X methylmutase [Bacillota bacterium]